MALRLSEGLGVAWAQDARLSDMDLPTASKRPVFPGSLLEDNHDVLHLELLAFKLSFQVSQEFLLDLDTSADRQKNFNQQEVIGSRCCGVWICWMKAEVVFVKFKDSLKYIRWRYSDVLQRFVNGFQNGGLELCCLGFSNSECNKWHSVISDREDVFCDA